MWREAAVLAKRCGRHLPAPHQRVVAIGCGTSLFMAQAFAACREDTTGSLTDAFTPSEMPGQRRYDIAVAFSRSGTTTEILDRVLSLRRSGIPVLALTAQAESPLGELASSTITLDFADEVAVVQSRFATSALAVGLVGCCDWDIEHSARAAEAVFQLSPPKDLDRATRVVFLGHRFTAGLANEAALKLREAVQLWTESYPTFEFRHGPISASGPSTVVWSFEPVGHPLAEQIRATGASVIEPVSGDPLAELVRVHILVSHLATARSLDPDAPRFLARSVILDASEASSSTRHPNIEPTPN